MQCRRGEGKSPLNTMLPVYEKEALNHFLKLSASITHVFKCFLLFSDKLH